MILISKKMHAFMLVAKFSSISEAAKALSLTVSPVSRLISEFESACKKKLFTRQGNRIALNADGDELYHQLDELYTQLNDIEFKLKKTKIINPIVIHHDWGKNFISIKNITGNILKKQEFVFQSIHQTDGITLGGENIYILSKDVPTDLHEKLAFRDTDRIMLYSSNDFNQKKHVNTLILFNDQLNFYPIKSHLERLRKAYKFNDLLVVSSEFNALDMVKNGYGLGITIQSNLHKSFWSVNDFHSIDVGIAVDSFIYLPKHLSTLQMKKELNGILWHHPPDDFLKEIRLC